MSRPKTAGAVLSAWLLLGGAAPLRAQPEDSLIAVSADVVEIAGSSGLDMGLAWTPFQTGITFGVKNIPGIFKLGDFARQTAVSAQLKMLETEGKAQILSNPKLIVQANAEAEFLVGGEVPFPVANAQSVGTEFKKYGVSLSIMPIINPTKKDTIRAELRLEVSNPNFSQTVQVGNTTVPSIVTRQLRTSVEIKSGETLVMGGLKMSTKNMSKSRIPYLGRIPLLGLLFTYSSVTETQQSLFLFITMEIVK